MRFYSAAKGNMNFTHEDSKFLCTIEGTQMSASNVNSILGSYASAEGIVKKVTTTLLRKYAQSKIEPENVQKMSHLLMHSPTTAMAHYSRKDRSAMRMEGARVINEDDGNAEMRGTEETEQRTEETAKRTEEMIDSETENVDMNDTVHRELELIERAGGNAEIMKETEERGEEMIEGDTVRYDEVIEEPVDDVGEAESYEYGNLILKKEKIDESRRSKRGKNFKTKTTEHETEGDTEGEITGGSSDSEEETTRKKTKIDRKVIERRGKWEEKDLILLRKEFTSFFRGTEGLPKQKLISFLKKNKSKLSRSNFTVTQLDRKLRFMKNKESR